VNKETGEVLESFAIITTDPPKFIHEIGHDRCPLFLKENAFSGWINSKEKDSEKLKDFLTLNQKIIEFSVEKDRALKPGWEKRV
jgi:putative SOS response-associated peptidase YedK